MGWGLSCSTIPRCIHEYDSSHRYGRHWRHVEASITDSVSEECLRKFTRLCIKLVEFLRRPLVDSLLEIGDDVVEFLDSCVAAFPTW
jgi:hypothetical protein